MPVTPCQSNDAPTAPTNESNDSLMWSLPKRAKGSGCNNGANEAVTTLEPGKTEPVEAVTEPEEMEPDEQEPSSEEDEPAPAELPSFLSCISDNAQDITDADGITRIDLEYDYEIHTTEDADLSPSVNRFELDLLKAVADEFSLTYCELLRRRSLRNNGRKLAGIASVVGVGSEPGDEQDSIHTECMMNTDYIESSNCTPMKGYMSAWVYESNERRLYESNIYSVIEGYSNSYATDEGVLAVSYIGTRPDVSEAAMPFIDKSTHDNGQRDDLATSSSSMGPGAIAGVTVASVVALIAVLALLAKKRRDRKNAEDRETSRKIVDDALFMSDVDDEEELMEVQDDVSKSSVNTEDHTDDMTLVSSNTFESEGEPDEEAGFEVNL